MKEFLEIIWNILILYTLIWFVYSFINVSYINKILSRYEIDHFNFYERLSLKIFTIFLIIGLFVNFTIILLLIMMSLIRELVLVLKIDIRFKRALIMLEIFIDIALIYTLI